MIVTFVSECEKKALKRSRRVLDAFADRIGHNTWQTVITEEGLDAVHSLLKKSATKNTAVSCHRIKSRIRTELQWIVGNKHKFNLEGNVPVNTTLSNQFIGEKQMNTLYANSQGQELAKHLFAVAVASQEFMKIFAPSDTQIQKAVFTAGCWHDVGKIDKQFQAYLCKQMKKGSNEIEMLDDGVHIENNKFSLYKGYPTHNEFSLLFFQLLASTESFDDFIKASIGHSIFWHHAKPYREKSKEITSITKIYEQLKKENQVTELISQIKILFESSIAHLYTKYFDKQPPIKINDLPENISGFLYDKHLPKYKKYEHKDTLEDYQDSIKCNANNNLIRVALISADRLISSISAEDLNQMISQKKIAHLVFKSLSHERGLKSNIENCLNTFEQNFPNSIRNIKQREVAESLADEEVEIAVLNGPAGCGKSKIALEWAKNVSAKQIIWICPRVQICQSLLIDLSSKDYLPEARIEIFTGEIKETTQSGKKYPTPENEYFSGDIIFTTIDQIINGMTTHRHIELFTKYMCTTIVFDEFHEYSHMSGFNILFAELIECKKKQKQKNTLLVSATPNYFFIDNFLNIKKGLEKIESFNDKPYTIFLKKYDENIIDDCNPFYSCSHDANTIIISNTAMTAQRSFIENQSKEKSLLIHSKFTSEDRKKLFNKVIDSFKKEGSCEFDILRSGPIIQASLNISCQQMISEVHCAENTLQRLGRLNRFSEHAKAEFIIYYTEDMESGKRNGNQSRFLYRECMLDSTKCWFTFLNEKDLDNIKIKQLYDYYEEFYACEKRRKIIEQDLLKSLQESVTNINANIFDPLKIKPKKSNIKVKKYSLRGRSRFVQMAKVSITNRQKYEIMDDYLSKEDVMTLSLYEIKGRGASDKNLLSFMQKKHHNIIKDAKKAYKDIQLENEARSPEHPIYVSYTPEDLDKIKAEPHDCSIYYFIGDKQPIGCLPIDKL